MPEAPASSPPPAGQVVLGFDFGTRRIGVAIGNDLTRGARPLRILATDGPGPWSAIAALLEEWRPDRLVVGVPRHPDGNPHEMTARCERFARQLEGRYGLPVERVDERYTSAVLPPERAPALRNAGREGGRDDEAAALIVQQWFDEREAREGR
jgi:putative Holliday junction resolvase